MKATKKKLLLKKKPKLMMKKVAPREDVVDLHAVRSAKLKKHEMSAAKWMLDNAAASNKGIAKLIHSMEELPREMIRDRLALLICDVLGLVDFDAVTNQTTKAIPACYPAKLCPCCKARKL